MAQEIGSIQYNAGLSYQSKDIATFCQQISSHSSTNEKQVPQDEFSSPSDEERERTSIPPPRVVVTIPAFNEEKVIASVVTKIRKVMDQTKYSRNYFVIVVNDGSTDATARKALQAGAHVFSIEGNSGLAATFRTEIKICSVLDADIIVHTDADGQYCAEQIPLLLAEIEKGHDLVLGSRFLGTIESMPFIKRFGNRLFSLLISLLTRRKISDGQTGFRAFTHELAQTVKIKSDHTYTQEQIIRAVQQNYELKEIPIRFAKRHNGKSRLMKNPFDYGFKAIKNIFRIYFTK